MTEPLAENRFTLTKALFCEGMREVNREGYGKTANRAVLGLLWAWLLLVAVTLALKQNPLYLAGEAVIMGLLALWIKLYMPSRRNRTAWRKLTEQCGGDLDRSICFYEDHLTVSAAGRDVTVAYGDLQKRLCSGHLLIFVAEDKTGILVKRDAFLKGDEAEVLDLIPIGNNQKK